MCEEPLLQLTTVTIMHRQQNSGIQSALALLAVELFSHALGIPKIPSQDRLSAWHETVCCFSWGTSKVFRIVSPGSVT